MCSDNTCVKSIADLSLLLQRGDARLVVQRPHLYGVLIYGSCHSDGCVYLALVVCLMLCTLTCLYVYLVMPFSPLPTGFGGGHEEDLDSVTANIEYVQQNILDLQNELIAVEDARVGNDERVGTAS